MCEEDEDCARGNILGVCGGIEGQGGRTGDRISSWLYGPLQFISAYNIGLIYG